MPTLQNQKDLAWYMRGASILKNLYEAGRKSLAHLVYGNTGGNLAAPPHVHVDHEDDLGVEELPEADRQINLGYVLKEAGGGAVETHHYLVNNGKTDDGEGCEYQEVQPHLVRQLSEIIRETQQKLRCPFRAQLKLVISDIYMSADLFEVSIDMTPDQIREEVEKHSMVFDDQIEKGLQSKNDKVGFVREFGVTITKLVQRRDRTSTQRQSQATAKSLFPEIEVSEQRKSSRTGRRIASYIPTPSGLRGRQNIVNIKNHHDQECFKYAVSVALHPDAFGRKSRTTATNWKRYFKHFNWGNMTFPMTLSDIQQFEDLNPTLAVNVVGWDNEKMVHFRERATEYTDRQTIWLLLISTPDREHWHFMTILNPSGFLGNGRDCKKHICPMCWTQYSSQKPFDAHKRNGCLAGGGKPTDVVPVSDRGIYFKDACNRMVTPQHTVLYADFESLTVPTTELSLSPDLDLPPSEIPTTSETTSLGTQEPMSYNIRCLRHTLSGDAKTQEPGRELPVIHRVRSEGMERHVFLAQFMSDLKALTKEVYDELRIVEPMNLTKVQREKVSRARLCCICKTPFTGLSEKRHAHHNHQNGLLIGAAHPKCNLDHNFEGVRFPVFFHNFTGYDSHLILEGSAPAMGNSTLAAAVDEMVDCQNCFDGKMEVIAENSERFKTIVWKPSYLPAVHGMRAPNISIEFKDSMAFYPGSLEALVEGLVKTDTNKFKVLRNYVKSVLPRNKVAEGFQLLLRKGVFPHRHMDSLARLEETSLPPIEKFFNSLKGKPCDPADYAHAQKVWAFFRHKTLKDYHDLYLNTDTALLSDCMQNYREMCLKVFGIEPCSKVGAPGLFWDAMLKHTGVHLEQLTDLEMMHFCEQGTRGGVTFTASQYAKANNKHLPGYDPTKKSTYLPYWDANSLYPHAMTQNLPYANFQWVLDEPSLEIIQNSTPKDDDRTGYYLEVDMHAPDSIHDAEADYPALAETVVIPAEHFSPHVSKRHNEVRTERKRLVNHLLPVKNYNLTLQMLHYLKERGWVVDKVHRAVRFSQSKWMKPFIDLCVLERQKARREGNKVLADFFKLAMNSNFGKCLESVRNRCDYRFAHTEDSILKLTNKHNYRGCKIIRPDGEGTKFNEVNRCLVGVMMAKETVMLDKPVYVGMSILDLSKIRMHRFLHKAKDHFQSAKLLYTDTDSLIMEVESEDLYADMAHPDIKDEFDFNGSDQPGCNNDNLPSAPGPMKLEPATDCHVGEIVNLFPKGYAASIYGADGQPYAKEPFKCTSKGFSMPSSKETFDVYKRCLFNDEHTHVSEVKLRSRNHIIHVERCTRVGAYSSMGDKRYPLEWDLDKGKFDSLPFGHYKIRPTSNGDRL